MKKYIPAVILACFLAVVMMLWVTQSTTTAPSPSPIIQSGDESNQGLMIRFSQESSGLSDSRVSRMPALRVPSGHPASPFLEPGPFRADWQGWIKIDEEDEYTFHFEGTGEMELSIDDDQYIEAGQSESEPIHLTAGQHRLQITYSSPTEGEARIRVLWSGTTFGMEPISPLNLTHDSEDQELAEASQLRQGRELLTRHQCMSCHEFDDPSLIDLSGAMPELAMDAPDLSDVSSRFQPGWMQAWVKDPQAMRTSARMPNMNFSDREAADIVAWLGSLGEAPPVHLPASAERIRNGGQLYAMQGCVACHSLEPGSGDDDRISLSGLVDKWYPAALEEYLMDPSRNYKWTGMPDFNLSEEEALSIASFLLDQSKSSGSLPDLDGDAQRGRLLAVEHGCATCHSAPVESQLQAPSLQALSNADWEGELNTSRTGNPHPELTSEEQKALQAVFSWGLESLNRRSPIEFATRQIRALDCQACHQIDGRGDRWSQLAGEVAPLLEGADMHPFAGQRPKLTWAGEKLQPEWLKQTLGGNLEQPARPWLGARMPAIGALPDLMAEGWIASHGYDMTYEDIEPEPELADRGRALAVGIGYLGCNSCHHGGQSGGMPAPHLNLLGDRLRPEFFRWMLWKPKRVDPQTAMPEYANEDGLTWQREIFGGDAEEQYKAIWHYLIAVKDKTDDEIRTGSNPPYAEMYQKMDKGPVYSGVTMIPDDGQRPKGLTFRVGDRQGAAMHFDHDLLVMTAAWTGDYLAFRSDGNYGLGAPSAAGDIQFTNPIVTGWTKQNQSVFTDTRGRTYGPIPEEQGQYYGMYQHGNRAVMSYSIYGTDVLESPWYIENGQTGAYVRDLKTAVHPDPLSVLLFTGEEPMETGIRESLQFIRSEHNGRVKAAAIHADDAELLGLEGQAALRLNTQAGERSIRVLLWEGEAGQMEDFLSLAAANATPDNLDQLTEPGPTLWEPLVTKGEVGESDGPYATDIITTPLENRYDAMFHFSGIDFFEDGRAALSTIQGDVWIVSGLDDSLEQITWHRFATGLNMPFGLRIVDGKIYISNEDELTVLHDRSGNGEADYYENFRNLISPGRGGWRQAFGLEVDDEGNFYFARGRGHRDWDYANGVFRISPDGKELERIARGFRQPWTMGISPEGNVTVTQQEGPFVPQTPIHMIDLETRKGDFYGDMLTYSHPSTDTLGPENYPRELGFEPPIVWLPRHIDSSAGGQIWVHSDVWGLPRNQMLHLAWSKGGLMQVMVEQIEGDRQGGVVPLVQFEGMRPRTGRFSPQDGQLYVTGFEEKGLQRVRYTGKDVNLPVTLNAHENGLRIRFSDPLDTTQANNLDNFKVHRWNYSWSDYYGSHHYSVENPGQYGEDPVTVASATLLDDSYEIFLEIPDMIPVNQMRVSYDLKAADGTPLQESIYNTVHLLNPEFTIP